MLTETARVLTSERVADLRPQAALKGAFGLTCCTCGGQFEMAFWQPQARCPHCQTLGYPDRARRNLLPLGWDCPTCGAANDGLHNFCTACGAGLASRCQRCEAPVYGVTCLRCGEHQARSPILQKSQSERIEWLPIQRERIERQQVRLREMEAEAAMAKAARLEEPQPAYGSGRRPKRRRSWVWNSRWGWMVLVGGTFMLARQIRDGSFAQITGSGAADLNTALTGLQGWWTAFVPSLWQMGTLTPNDPEYAYLFGVVLIGLISLPFGLYFIHRIIRRLMP